ncbi:hypothetical protein GGR88_002158 [Sphingomonas jejuensis]|uniref:HEAT repeat domain-containing protein n=1 Tax=Sphingomonas jejuensis TaxID=904715 RepID=A0ABX0XPD1_9SPHN|nr:hypothetical protein [Sphingomonas jejuensis]NJC34644.1 hypothetical protein [Sphingomonas jejuensis]
MRDKPFTIEEERFIAQQLGAVEDRQVQRALQFLCEQYRRGRFSTDSVRLRTLVINCLFRNYEGVKRWALNALVEIGLGAHRETVVSMAPSFLDHPDLYASFVRLIFFGEREDKALLTFSRLGLPLHGLALIAGAEHSHQLRRRLIKERIPLERADVDELRAAIVLTGRQKAPPHIFLPNHSNELALGELTLHDSDPVKKYAIWAQAERRLGFSALRIPISDYDSSAPQVRKWILRLLFSDPDGLSKNIDLIKHAQLDDNEDVRQEAAIQLRSNYVLDGSPYLQDWLASETHEPTKLALLDHITAFAYRDPSYLAICLSFYREAPLKSVLRTRLEAAASGTSVFKRLRAIELEEESASLFSNDNEWEGRSVTNLTQNFYAPVGSATGTGAISADTISAISNVNNVQLQSALLSASSLLEKLKDEDIRAEGKVAIESVAKAPSRLGIGRVIDWLGKIKNGMDTTSGLISSADGLIETFQNMDFPG